MQFTPAWSQLVPAMRIGSPRLNAPSFAIVLLRNTLPSLAPSHVGAWHEPAVQPVEAWEALSKSKSSGDCAEAIDSGPTVTARQASAATVPRSTMRLLMTPLRAA